MGARRLPAHIRQMISARERKPERASKPMLLKAAGVDSEIELTLANRLNRAGLPPGVPQFRFVDGRQFRFDRAWPDRMVAVEVQGGIWSQNGHGRGSIIARDCAKLSLAAALGWRVLPLTKEMIEDGQAVDLIAQALVVRTR